MLQHPHQQRLPQLPASWDTSADSLECSQREAAADRKRLREHQKCSQAAKTLGRTSDLAEVVKAVEAEGQAVKKILEDIAELVEVDQTN